MSLYTIPQLADKANTTINRVYKYVKLWEIQVDRQSQKAGGYRYVVNSEQAEKFVRLLKEHDKEERQSERTLRHSLNERHPRVYHSIPGHFIKNREWKTLNISDRWLRKPLLQEHRMRKRLRLIVNKHVQRFAA